MKNLIVTVTTEYQVKIDETNEIVKQYKSVKELIQDCIGYEFSSTLPVIASGAVQRVNTDVLEIEIEKLITEKQIDWTKAKEYLDEIRKQYTEIGSSGLFALQLTINPLLVRYDKGERTQDLYDNIMSLQ